MLGSSTTLFSSRAVSLPLTGSFTGTGSLSTGLVAPVPRCTRGERGGSGFRCWPLALSEDAFASNRALYGELGGVGVPGVRGLQIGGRPALIGPLATDACAGQERTYILVPTWEPSARAAPAPRVRGPKKNHVFAIIIRIRETLRTKVGQERKPPLADLICICHMSHS